MAVQHSISMVSTQVYLYGNAVNFKLSIACIHAGGHAIQQQLLQYRQEIQEEMQQHRQEVLGITERSTRSASDIGKSCMSSPAWEQGESTAAIQQMLANSCADPQTVAAELLAVIPHTWEELAAAEKELCEREKRKRKPGDGEELEGPQAAQGAGQGAEKTENEATVQRGTMYMLRKVKELVPAVCWYEHDTSASGLAGRQGVNFTAAPLQVWPQLLFYSELRSKLMPLPAQHAVIGQLLDRSFDAFERQPPQRSHIFGLAAGADAVQVLCMRKHSSPSHTRIEPFSFQADSPGLLLWLSLLLANKDVHGFVETQPPVISIPGARLSGFVLVDWRAEDEELGGSTLTGAAALDAVPASSTVRSSQVWRASIQLEDKSQQEQVAVKTGPLPIIKHEVSLLWLASFQNACSYLGLCIP